MKTLFRLILAAGLSACLWAAPALAASQVMCGPEASVGSQPRQVNNPSTGNTYGLNGQGCAVMRNDDAAYFAAQGFTQGSNTNSVVFTQQTTGFQFTLPLSAFLRNITGHEGTGNATASGICIGSTSAGSDVATLTGAGSTLKVITDASMAKRVLSTTAPSAVFVNSCANTGFGTSIWDFTIEFGYF